MKVRGRSGSLLRVDTGLVRWLARGLVCALVVPFAGVARGAERVDAPVHAAIALYDNGQLEEAEGALKSALPKASTPRNRALVHLHLGLILANRADLAGARAAFRAALEEDPTVGPDRVRVFPAIVELFDGVRQGVRGEAELSANEAGARILVDDRAMGIAPLKLQLPVGDHQVRALSADGDRASDAVMLEVRARTPVRVALALKARAGTLFVKVSPESATVTLDGVLQTADGKSTLAHSGLRVAAGRHRIELSLPGHERVLVDARVAAGGVERVERTLLALRPPWYRRKSVWAVVAAGTSGAALLAGLLTGRSASANESDLRRGERAGTLDQDRYDLLARSAQDNARAANILFGVSAAAAVTSVVLALLGDERAPPVVKKGVTVVPTSTGLAFEVRY